jgi:two-component system cell cycle sensor histidine kinase/response regulator CckA
MTDDHSTIPAPDFRTLFESAPGSYLVLSPDLTIVAVSEAYLRATMTDRADIVGRGLFEVFPDNPDDPGATGVSNLSASLERVLRSKTADTMAVQKYDIRRPGRGEFEERYWSPINSPVLSETGELVYIIHRVEDVTDFIRLKQLRNEQYQLTEDLRERAEQMETEVFLRAQELQEANRQLQAAREDLETRVQERTSELEAAAEAIRTSEESYRLLFESNPHPMWVYDVETLGFLAVNDAAIAHYGYTPDEFRAMSIMDIRPPEEVLPLLQAIRELSPDKTSVVFRKHCKKDGTIIDVEGTSREVYLAGRRARLVLAIDITERKRQEEALHESEERYRTVTETASEAIITIDEDSNILFVNHAAEVTFGYSSKEMLGQKLTMLMPDYLRKLHQAGLKRYAAAGEKHIAWHGTELPGLHKSGTEVPLEISFGEFLRNGQRFFTGICRDITERKRADEERERLAAIVASSREAIISIVDDHIASWNAGAENMYGYTEAEAVGRHISLLLPPDRADELEQVRRKLQRNERIEYLETERLRKDGSRIDVSISVSPIRDDGGRPIGAATIARDITERKRIERELRRSEERYSDLVENAHDIIYTHDLQGNYTSVNKAGERITGYTKEETLKMNLAQAVAPESVEYARRMMRQKLAGEEETVYELEIIAKDGRRVAIEVNTRLIYQDGAPVGVQGIGRDVTERKQLEQQLRQSQKLEAIGQLAGGIAHDFNNLLTAIIGYSDLLLHQIGTDQGFRAEVEEISAAGKRAAGLTNQLLAFSRRQVLQPVVLNLNDVVVNIERMLRRLIGEDIDIVTVTEQGLGLTKIDQGQCEQVLMNLAVNARDAMPAGGKLTIETANVELDETYTRNHSEIIPGRYILLAVSDTGLGIDAETQTHIFEPFFTTKDPGKGTGLGLSTVYGIVRQSYGHIWLYSEPGHGATFKVYFPRVDEVGESRTAQSQSPSTLTGSENIMLVEDDESVRNLSRLVLEEHGYTVLAAESGVKALEAFGPLAAAIDLVVTDVIMPQMNGAELTTRLRELHPEVKVLYVSGYTEEATIHRGVLVDGVDFLQKPFTPEGLARKVREVLEKNPE